MSKKPVVDVDEEMIRDVMREVPAGRNRQPVKAETETVAPKSGAMPEKPTPTPTAQTVPTSQAEPKPAQVLPSVHTEPKESESAKRGQYRKRRQQEEEPSYCDRFLVNDGVRYRVTTAIDRDIHKKMKKLLVLVAPEVTVVSYISNVLAHHLELFRNEIDELYKRETEKPL